MNRTNLAQMRWIALLMGATLFSGLAAEPSVGTGREGLTLDLGGGQNLKLAAIPAGKFMMGSPATEFKGEHIPEVLHEVTISKPFYMGTTHVTVDQFGVFVKATGYKTDAEKEGGGPTWQSPGIEQKGDHPVVCISWNDAKAFCDWLALQQKKKCHLPTEAQWEYACRAGTQTAYCWGDKAEDGKDAWVKWGCSKGQLTYPVASLKPNAWGLYDMHGNALQWCSDFFGELGKEAVTDPVGFKTPYVFDGSGGKSHVLRGGAGHLQPSYCRSAFRQWDPAIEHRFCSLGFRVCVEGP